MSASGPIPSVPTETQPSAAKSNALHIDRLPTVSECTTHLQLLDAFVHLKEAVDHRGREEEGLLGGQAWVLFCRAAAAKFLEWSRTVDGDATDGIALPTPPLDVLLVWHAFMLNPSAYKRYADVVLQGRLGGKGIDWEDLQAKLNSDYANPAAHHTSADLGVPDAHNEQQQQQHQLTTPDGFDLVAAVQRQLRFSQSMHAARWLSLPRALRAALLGAALARYAQFLSLAAENRGVGIAPALDVDLAWHTHLLSPRRYAAWCLARAGSGGAKGRLVDHRDDLAPDVLARSADDAARLWKARFGVEYRVCLCRRCVGARFALGKGGGDGDGGSASSSSSEGDVDRVDCAAGCAGEDVGSAAAGGDDRCPSQECATNCEPVCQTTQCGAKCGYVCGACDSSD